MTQESPFRPKGTIRITAEDVEKHRVLVQALEVDTSTMNTTHPFDRPDFIKFLEQEFPEIIEKLKNVNRPVKSGHPDELEEWETERILKRKERKANESDWEYLMRFLYEEFFSVNQTPDSQFPQLKAGMPGMTNGGLISHFYNLTNYNGVSAEEVVRRPYKGRTMSEAILSLNESNGGKSDWRSNRQFVDIVELLTKRNDRWWLEGVLLRPGRNLDEVYLGSANYQAIRPELDSVGYRLLAILKVEPEFMKPVDHASLKELIGMSVEDEISRAYYFVRVWHHFQQLLDNNGFFKRPDELGMKELLKRLLVIRTHPEMQIFFKYLSPSGFINEWMEKE